MTKKMKLLLVIVLSVLAANSANSIEYDDYIDLLYAQSPLIKAKLHEVEAEREMFSAANKYYIPKIGASSIYKNNMGISDPDVVESKLSISSVVFDDATLHKISEAELKVLSADLGVAREKEKIKLDVTGSLIGIQYNLDLKRKSEDLRRSSVTLMNSIRDKFNSGVASSTELEQAQLLVQKIDGEINVIDKNLDLLRSKIEVVSGLPYPESGVYIGGLVDRINSSKSKVSSHESVVKSIEYLTSELQSRIAYENAEQQNSLYTISLVGELNYDDDKRRDVDSYVGAQIALNIFDYDKIKASSSRNEMYSSLKVASEMKRRELLYLYNSNSLELSAIDGEISDLVSQKSMTEKIINGQQASYDIGKSSLYEMLSTRFDFFVIERDLTELLISKASIELANMRLTGDLLEM